MAWAGVPVTSAHNRPEAGESARPGPESLCEIIMYPLVTPDFRELEPLQVDVRKAAPKTTSDVNVGRPEVVAAPCGRVQQRAAASEERLDKTPSYCDGTPEAARR